MYKYSMVWSAAAAAVLGLLVASPSAAAGDGGLPCGGLVQHRQEWSPWYPVAMENGVEAQVRYLFKRPGTEVVLTVMQLRYINHSSASRTARISNVRFSFTEGTPALWTGESVRVAPRSVAKGAPQELRGRLCTWTKAYFVR